MARWSHPAFVTSVLSGLLVAVPATVLAHGGEDHGVQAAALRWTDWSFDPAVIAGLLLAGWIYLRLRRRFPVRRGQPLYFWAGLLLVFLAWESPLDRGSEEFLFTLHMIQHTLTMVFVPLLVLRGTPPGFLVWLREETALGPLVQRVWRPLPAFALYNANFALWHLPSLYDLALRSSGVHDLQHVLYLAFGILFWGVVTAPHPRLIDSSDGARVTVLIGTNVVNWLVSVPLAFSDTALYPTYAAAARLWGLSPVNDQALGAGIMWMMGHLLYGVPLILVLVGWLRREERRVAREALTS